MKALDYEEVEDYILDLEEDNQMVLVVEDLGLLLLFAEKINIMRFDCLDLNFFVGKNFCIFKYFIFLLINLLFFLERFNIN